MCARILVCFALTLALVPTKLSADEPELDPADPKGMPTGFKAGLSSRFAIWYDNDGWHVRVTTASALTAFTGLIEPKDGKIVNLKLVSGTTGKKGGDLPGLGRDTKSIDMNNEISKGLLNGYDFKLDDKVTAIKFDLKVAGKAEPSMIFIGAKGARPKEAVFYLPANPGKKK